MVEIKIECAGQSQWFDLELFNTRSSLEDAIEEFQNEIDAEGSPWEIVEQDCDYFDFPEAWLDSRNLDALCDFADAYSHHGIAWVVYAEWVGYDSATESHFRDTYHGTYGSQRDFAESLFTSLYEIPDELLQFIDWDAAGESLEHDYYVEEYDGEVYVFNNI